jgi:hypothetical protein
MVPSRILEIVLLNLNLNYKHIDLLDITLLQVDNIKHKYFFISILSRLTLSYPFKKSEQILALSEKEISFLKVVGSDSSGLFSSCLNLQYKTENR